MRRRWTRPSWQALAASIAIAFVLGGGSTWAVLRPAAGDRTAAAVLDGHMRGLMAPHPTDMNSSERHTVKPSFNGRIPQAPRVVDLAQEGFPDRRARGCHRQHASSHVGVWSPSPHHQSVGNSGRGPRPGRAPLDQADNVVSWRENGVSYWAVSDLGVGELETLRSCSGRRRPARSNRVKRRSCETARLRPPFPS